MTEKWENLKARYFSESEREQIKAAAIHQLIYGFLHSEDYPKDGDEFFALYAERIFELLDFDEEEFVKVWDDISLQDIEDWKEGEVPEKSVQKNVMRWIIDRLEDKYDIDGPIRKDI